MSHLNFWRSWRKKYRNIYQLLLIIFAASIALSFYTQYNSMHLAAPLEEVRKTESIDLSLHTVYDFVFDLNVPARNYVIFQGFLALKSGFQADASYWYLAFIFACFSFLITASTYFNRLWFIIFQSIIVVWVITFKLQYLKIFDVESQLFSFVFVGLFLGVGYLFHAFKTEVGIFWRWLSFAGILLLLLLLVGFGSSLEAPFVFMAQHGIIVPVILSVIFIFNVAYDIILHILYILAGKKSEGESSNLWHLLILSVLYLSYVGLTFAKNNFLINWDIIYLDEFLLLAVSAILGIWGFRKRSELFSKQLSFRPLGGYLYLVFGIITFSTISWIFANGNDPLVESLEDMITFSHLGFGLMFLIYVVYNFVGLLKEGHGIYPVVFRPVNIPYNLVRFVGLAIIAALVLRVSYLPYYQVVAGYYNGLGDYYEYIQEDAAAETTFKIARQYAVTNHKSNFEIGQMQYEDRKWAEASNYFKQASWKNPSVQAYINRSQSQMNASLYFDALFTLESAQEDFPDNAYLLNMRGLVYEELNQVDSAFIYFDAAERAASSKSLLELVQANKLALFAKNNVYEELSDEEGLRNKPVPYQANYTALANRNRKVLKGFNVEINAFDSILTYNDFSLLFNYTLNKTLMHERFTADTIGWFKNFDENKAFFKSIDYARASRENYAGDQKTAYSMIYDLENAEISDAGFYYLTHGLWLYEQGAYEMAEEHFQEADKLKMSEASTFRVISLIQSGRLFEAARLYEKQFEGTVVDESVVMQDPLYQFLQGNTAELPASFLFLWLKTNESLQEEERNAIKERLKNSPFLKLYELKQIEILADEGAYEIAWKQLSKINLDEGELGLIAYKNNLKAMLIVKMNSIEKIEQLDENQLQVYPKNYQLLFKAFSTKISGDSVAADQLMWQLGNENVFFEQGVVVAADYFRAKGQEDEAYNLLVEAARLNENSAKLLKAYTLQALRMNLSNYAEESLQELEKMLPTDEYEKFKNRYEEIKKMNLLESW